MKIGKRYNWNIVWLSISVILLFSDVAYSEHFPIRRYLRVSLGDYKRVQDALGPKVTSEDTIINRISSLFYLPIIEDSEAKKIVLEAITLIKDRLDITITRPAVNVHIQMIVRAGLRVGKNKEAILKDIQLYIDNIKEDKQRSRILNKAKGIINPFVISSDKDQIVISESEILVAIETEINRLFGSLLPHKIYVRTTFSPGTINEHYCDPISGEIFLDSRNIGYPWAIFEELLHSTSGGLPSLILDEGYTNILVKRASSQGIFKNSKYYDIIHYPPMQELVDQLIQVIGEEAIGLSYFTGDERYITHAFGKNGRLVLFLLCALDDFWIDTFGMFEVESEEIVQLILENRYSEKNLKLINDILMLRYKYWKKHEYTEANRKIIFDEIERLKSLFEPHDESISSSHVIRWNIFEGELKRLLTDSKNPFLVELIRRLLSNPIEFSVPDYRCLSDSI